MIKVLEQKTEIIPTKVSEIVNCKYCGKGLQVPLNFKDIKVDTIFGPNKHYKSPIGLPYCSKTKDNLGRDGCFTLATED